MFKKVGIIGVGFMGGSFALAYKEKFPQSFIFGFARSQSSYRRLRKLNILDKVSKDLEEVVSDSELVVLSLPIYVIIEYFKIITPYLKKNTILIDLGSTKVEIEKAAQKSLFYPNNFVGCHPLCGSEKSGGEYAQKDLYKNSLCIITSSKRLKSTRMIKKLWESLGSKVYFMSASNHDKIISYVSHLPHILSFSLIKLVPKTYYSFSSSSFQEMTRIGASSAYLWRDIFLSNSKNITKNITAYIKVLQGLNDLIKKKKGRQLFSTIKKTSEKIKEKSIL